MEKIADMPKYQQVYRVILARLKDGRYSVGGRIPTEVELANNFQCSRVTIRRSLDMLVQDGYLESRQGSGYRVLTLSPVTDNCLTSFTDAVLQVGKDPTSKLISIEHFSTNSSRLASLPSAMQNFSVTRIIRLRLVDDKATALVMTYALSSFLRNVSSGDFPESGPGQSILRILKDRFQLNWSTAREDISPISATEELAETFSISRGTPMLKQRCTAFDDHHQVAFHEEVFRHGSINFNLSQHSRVELHV